VVFSARCYRWGTLVIVTLRSCRSRGSTTASF